MLCPVCHTLLANNKSCPECGFKNSHTSFADEAEKNCWENDVVLQYRERYWQQLTQFEFEGTTLKKYKDKQKRIDTIKIPYGVEKIGKKAFHNAQFIKFVDMPNTVKEIDNDAFNFCLGLQHINLSSNLRTIGIRAFSFCQGLEMIKIPQKVEYIKKEAFDNCWNLLVVITPNNIKLGESVYYNCPCLKLHYS